MWSCGEVACAPARDCVAGSVMAGRVSGAQAGAHRGKREILAQLCLEQEGRRLRGIMGCLMHSMSLCNFCFSEAEGHLRFRLA